MAEETFVDKAGETVGIGVAMASDVAGAIKTAIDAAVTTVTEVMKTPPAKNATGKKEAKKSVTKNKTAKKTPAKKVAKKTAVKKTPVKKAAKKSLKKPAKKAGRLRR